MTRKIFLMAVAFVSILNAELFDYQIAPSFLGSSNSSRIKILDSKEVRFGERGGVAFREISDLAYKEDRLFALSDRGVLHELNIDVKNDKINRLDLTNATALKDEKGEPLDAAHRDSEGLSFMGERLLVSFENKHRVEAYSQNARKIKNIKINKSLKRKGDYSGPNKGLEAVAFSEKYGTITAPESPLKGKKSHAIYSKSSRWKFKADGVIKAFEFIDEDRLLVLLRGSSKNAKKMVVSLVRVNLLGCENGECESEVLLKMDESDGWNLYNFEGLCKVGENRFLMISDDGGDSSQKTILTLFEITTPLD